MLSGSSVVDSKQSLLDLTDQVSEEAKAQRAAEEENKRASAESEIGRDWVMGVVLLGAAAEELSAEVKRGFAADLLRLSSLISDDWIRSRSDVDYEDIKSQMTEKLTAKYGDESAEKISDLVNMAVDFVELREVTNPFFSIHHILGEHARNQVLGQSLMNLKPNDVVEELSLALWRLETNAEAGAKALNRVMPSLPKTPFLRTTIANHLLARAFWYKGNTKARTRYVEGAREALQPLQVSVNPDTLEKQLDSD